MASVSGFHYSQDDTRRMLVNTNANRSSSASAFFHCGAAPFSSGDTAEATDAEQEELRISEVLIAVQRSFATVRAALTEQRGKVADIWRQLAAGIAQTDALAVPFEHSMAAHAADRAMLIKMS
ncbi:hypothetical protein I4F81_005137 [Pyropia yezoensis]|uniref:Uncharacterized protein n=1 Tax=Pyropia yezoensis TaxID=2788 RepID=A0ACC3BXY7_PYRYE|nr:hypothetical protein I4F81_005137 [Neopyropia yezoensis]